MRKSAVFVVMAAALLVAAPLTALQGQRASDWKPAVPRGPSSGETDAYDLLIVSPGEWTDSLQPLVIHKDGHGVATKLVSLSEVYDGAYFEAEGRDEAEQVKYFIKNALDEWGISYVMLVGGRNGGLMQENWYCPVRYSFCGVSSSWERSFLSDLYFADIYDDEGHFQSWDTDGDGVYAEWVGSEAEDAPLDLYPDVAVGRLACRAEWEVNVMVDKIVTYENTAYNAAWFDRMVCIAGDTYPDNPNPAWDEQIEGEEGTQRAMDWMPGFDYVTLWTSDGTLTGPEDVISTVSQGCGFLFFDGHGSPMSWATHPPHDHETWIDGLDIWQMRKLDNQDMLPVCVVGGCHNSQFNISVLNALKIYKGFDTWYEYMYKGETGPECWSWWLTRKIGGGSIATLGYSALGYTKEDKWEVSGVTGEASEWLDTHFFREYGMEGTEVLGDIWSAVIADYLDTYPVDWDESVDSATAIDAKTAQEWILLGDPSLRIGGYP